MTVENIVREIASLYGLEGGVRKSGTPLRLDAIVSQHRNQRSTDLDVEREKILATLDRLVRKVPLSSEREAIEEAKKRCVSSYLFAVLDAKYDTISPELFDLKRVIEVEKDGNSYEVKLPVFARAQYGSSDPWRHESRTGRKIITLESQIPPIPERVREDAKEVRALLAESYAHALRTPLVGDLLESNRFLGNLGLDIYWIPKPSELQIKVRERDPDPILIGALNGKHYLIAKWDVQGEEPFEHYLMEYKNEKA